MKKKHMIIQFVEEVERTDYNTRQTEYESYEQTRPMMNYLERRLSADLFEMIKLQLSGFDYEMQYEMTENLVCFVRDQMVCTTGCYPADNILSACFAWIGDEFARRRPFPNAYHS